MCHPYEPDSSCLLGAAVKAEAVRLPVRFERRVRDGGTLIDVCRGHASDQPFRIAYRWLEDGEDESAALTFAELDRRARAIGATLQARGLAGERVLILHPPGLDFVCAFLGCLYAGAAAVPVGVPTRHHGAEGPARIAADADVRASLAPLRVQKALAHAGDGLADLLWLPTESVTDGAAEHWHVPDVGPGDLALLQYTSGSTGEPKGVAVTHGNLLHNQAMIAAGFGHSDSTVFVGWLPLHHDMGLIGNVLQPMFLGIPCTLMAPEAFAQKPIRWLRAITRYGATTSGAPNFAYELCARRIPPAQREGLDLRSWQVAYNGAEPIRAETMERFAKEFAPHGFRYESFYPCYGMAEATLFATGRKPGAPPEVATVDSRALEENRVVSIAPGTADERRLVGCGGPWGDLDVVIADPVSHEPCVPDRVGEIWLRGPSIARGYEGRSEQTARAFGARLAGERRPYLRTGDLGFVREGQLFVTGRRKDIILVRGRNHYPQDIEHSVASSHPALRPGCGVAFAIEGEVEERLVVVQEVRGAACEPLANEPAARAELCGAIRQAASRHHGLRAHDVVLVRPGTLAKTTSGKLRRTETRRRYLGNELERLAPVEPS
jgi:acyl-CoA synthetase (AMP-forming)/AMP-acid ligase II